ncbi:MAG: FAD-dependent monooxygenase [Nannocystaceae bacterium]
MRGVAALEADVVILGAGPAGLACARRLIDLGVERVVLAPLRGRARPWGETLAPEVRGWLRAIGRDDALAAAGAAPSAATIAAWGEPVARGRPSILSPEGPAWHVDRGAFDRRLAEGLELRRLAGARLRDLEREGEGLRVRTDVDEITARFVVDATGSAALAAGRLGVGRRVVDRMVALCARGRPIDPGTAALAVESAADGWWYASPIGEATSVVWVTDPRAHRGGTVAAAARAAWTQLLLLPRHVRLDEAATWSARVVTVGGLERPGGAGWIAIGDAAFAPDPMAGMGVTLALEDGVRSAEALARALAGDRGAIEGEVERVRGRGREHLEAREEHLEGEARFADAPFWRARRGRAAPPSWG